MSKAFPRLFVIGNCDTFLFLEWVGKLCLTTSRGKSQGYCEIGKFLRLVRTFIVFFCFLLYHYYLPDNVCLPIFVALDRPKLEDQYSNRVHAALAFTCEIEDFDNLVDPRHLFDCCLGPEPSNNVLEKICREEKSKIIYFLVPKILLFSLASPLLCPITYFSF